MRRVVCCFVVLAMCVAVPYMSRAEKERTDPSNVAEVTNVIVSVSGADVSVAKERASLSSSWIMKLFSPRDLELKKASLVVELKKRTHADVIIDPQFIVEKRILGGGKITLSGYPAYYTNFRNLTPVEVDSLILKDKYKPGTVIFYDKSVLDSPGVGE